MPSVASEVSTASHYAALRAQSPAHDHARPEADQDAPSPFAMLLDTSADAKPEATPLNDRTEMPRRDDAAAADGHKADAAPAKSTKDSTSAKDGKDARKSDASDKAADAKDAKSDKTVKVATDVTDDATTDTDKDKKSAADAGDKVVVKADAVLPTADQKPQVDASAVAAVTPVVEAATPAPVKAKSDGDKAAAIAAAAADAANAKAADPTTPAKGIASGKAAATTDAAAAKPQFDPGKAAAEHVEGDHGTTHHAETAKTVASALETATEPGARNADATAAKPGADAVQSLNISTSTSPANAATATSANAPVNGTASTAPVPLAGLAVAIASQADAGKHRFEIRLDPPELGRIEVRLDVDRGGNVSTRLVVDRADTLDLLRRDAPNLERALQDAGLKTGDGSLQFQLRDQSLAGRDDNQNFQSAAHVVVPDDNAAPLEAMRQGYGRLLGLGGGIDIKI